MGSLLTTMARSQQPLGVSGRKTYGCVAERKGKLKMSRLENQGVLLYQKARMSQERAKWFLECGGSYNPHFTVGALLMYYFC